MLTLESGSLKGQLRVHVFGHKPKQYFHILPCIGACCPTIQSSALLIAKFVLDGYQHALMKSAHQRRDMQHASLGK